MNIARTLELQRKLRCALYEHALGRRLVDPGIQDRLASLLAEITEITDTEQVADSLSAWPTPDKAFSVDEIDFLCEWFAGVFHLAGRRRLTVPPTMVRDVEPSGVMFADWSTTQAKGPDRRYVFSMKVTQGNMAGGTFEWRTGQRWLWRFSKDLGFSRRIPWSGRPAELIGLHFTVDLTEDSFGRLGFEIYHVPKNFRSFNVQLLRLRQRPCPRKYPWACYECPVGYNDCVLATRPKTAPVRLCLRSKSHALGDFSTHHSGWMLGENDDLCFVCQYQRRR